MSQLQKSASANKSLIVAACEESDNKSAKSNKADQISLGDEAEITICSPVASFAPPVACVITPTIVASSGVTSDKVPH